MVLWRRRRKRKKTIDIKRKSGCQRQLSLFFYISQENKYLQHILLRNISTFISISIPCHPIPHPKSQQNAKPNPTNPSIRVSIQAKKPAPIPKMMMNEKSTKPLPDGGQDAWLNVLGTHLIYISTWGTYFCPAFLNHT